VFLAVSSMDDDDFLSYGWRIPFLLSAVLVVVGFVIRVRLTESVEFSKVKKEKGIAKVPFTDLIRRHPRNLILGGLAAIAPPAVGYAVTVYMLTYGTQTVGFERNTLLTLILASTVVWIGTIVVSAMISDRFSSKRVYIIGAVTAVVWPIPMFALVNTASVVLALIAFTVAAAVQGIMAGAQGGLFTELFPTKVRYSGISIAYAVGATVSGAVTPALPALRNQYDSSTPVALFISALGVVSLVAVLGVRRIKETPQTDEKSDLAVASERA
jgi:MFS family permease